MLLQFILRLAFHLSTIALLMGISQWHGRVEVKYLPLFSVYNFLDDARLGWRYSRNGTSIGKCLSRIIDAIRERKLYLPLFSTGNGL